MERRGEKPPVLAEEVNSDQKKLSRGMAKSRRRKLAEARKAQINGVSLVAVEPPVNSLAAQIDAIIIEKRRKAEEKGERRRLRDEATASVFQISPEEARRIAADDRIRFLENGQAFWENDWSGPMGFPRTREEYIEQRLELLMLRWRVDNQVPFAARNRLAELNEFVKNTGDNDELYVHLFGYQQQPSGSPTTRFNQIVQRTLNEREQQRYQAMTKELGFSEIFL